MHIRPMQAGDAIAVAELHTASWRDVYRGMLPDDYLANSVEIDLHERWTKIDIQPDDHVLVAEDDGITGFIAVWVRPDPFIDNLHVHPAMRSMQIGKKLMQTAAERLMANGHRSVYLWVLEKNTRARDFYERLGGQVTERIEKDIFGNNAMHEKIEWADLSVLSANQE